MTKAIFLAIAFTLMPLGPEAEAKVELTYDVQVETKNQSDGAAELLTMLSGYECRASTTMGYSEVMKDHEGKEKRVPKEQSYKQNWSTLWEGGRTAGDMRFKRNLSTMDPNISVNLQETCERRYTCTREENSCDTDRNGNMINCRMKTVADTCTETRYLNWSCKFGELPFGKGAARMRCLPDETASTWNADPLLRLLRKKEIYASVRHVNTEERFVHDACPAGGKNARIVHFEQGMGGHAGEDDFELLVKINGRSFPIHSQSGLYSEDIRVCAEGAAPLQIEVEGVERDLFYDDQYKPAAGQSVIDLNKGEDQEVVLNRETYFGKVFTPKQSRIKVQVLK